eukprot:11647089-Heterocapsa_arctica.AAC.1
MGFWLKGREGILGSEDFSQARSSGCRKNKLMKGMSSAPKTKRAKEENEHKMNKNKKKVKKEQKKAQDTRKEPE